MVGWGFGVGVGWEVVTGACVAVVVVLSLGCVAGAWATGADFCPPRYGPYDAKDDEKPKETAYPDQDLFDHSALR